MDTLTPAPILNAIAEPPLGLTPRVWARWFQDLRETAMRSATSRSGEWRWNTSPIGSIADGDAANDSLDYMAATAVRLSIMTRTGTDASNVLSLIRAGDDLAIQDQDDAAHLVRYRVTELPLSNGAWYSIPVHGMSWSGTTFANNAPVIVQLILRSGTGGGEGVPGPQGPAGPAGPAGPTGPAGADATLGPTLTTIEALTGTANTMLYFTGTDVAALTALSAYARTLLDDADALTARGTLGLGTAAVEAYTVTTFTAACTGLSGTVSGTARVIQTGKMVHLHLPQLNGTSNATSFGILGLPAGLAVSGTVRVPVLVDSNGTFQFGVLQLAGTTLDVYSTPGFGGWVASGNKGLYPPVIAYLLV